MNGSDEGNNTGFELDDFDFSLLPPFENEAGPGAIPEPEPAPVIEKANAASAMKVSGRKRVSGSKAKKVLLAAAGGTAVFLILALVLTGVLGLFGKKSSGPRAPVVSLNQKVQISFKEFQSSLVKLKGLSKFINNPAKLDSTLAEVVVTEKLFVRGNKATEKFLRYLNVNGVVLEKRGLGIYNEIGKFYRGKTHSRYNTAAKRLLGDLATVLKYRKDHYDLILSGAQPYRETHDLYYKRYRQSEKRYRFAYPTYMKFLEDRIKNNGKLSGLLVNSMGTLKSFRPSWLKF